MQEEAKNALELADDDIKHARDLIEKYKNETVALKVSGSDCTQSSSDENACLPGNGNEYDM